MSQWYQWFIAAPMMTIERPLVFSALRGELARHRDDLVARHAGDLLRPGRRVGHVVVVGLGDVLAAEAAVDAVVGDEQVEHRGDQRLAVRQLQRACTGTLRTSTLG